MTKGRPTFKKWTFYRGIAGDSLLKPHYYKARDKPLKNMQKRNPPKLRKSITPGTVLIMLKGKYKGARVVFLKQLESGLLLVTGPMYFNGVPLRRTSQKYVIATSTKLDIGDNVSGLDKVTDKSFATKKKKEDEKDDEDIFEDDEAKTEYPEVHMVLSKPIDDHVLAVVKKHE